MMKIGKFIIVVIIEIMLLGCCNQSSYMSKKIHHNTILGKVIYMNYITNDTGYIVSSDGNFYDSILNTYIYKTTNGGEFWNLECQLSNYSIGQPNNVLLYNNRLYTFCYNGTMSNGYRNYYLCKIDLQTKQYFIYPEPTNSAGFFFVFNDSIYATSWKNGNNLIIHFDYDMNKVNSSISQLKIKDVAQGEKGYAIITYDSKIYIYDNDSCVIFNNAADKIIPLKNDNYLFVDFGNYDDNSCARVFRICHNDIKFQTNLYQYKILKFTYSHSNIIVAFAKKNVYSLSDIIYSNDYGQTWEQVHLRETSITPHCCYFPYIYLYKETYIEKIKLPLHTNLNP